MPNWCFNTVELYNVDAAKLDALEKELEKEDAQPLNHLRPNPSGEWDYDWSVTNWGTKWDISTTDWERFSDTCIRMNFDSAWAPPTALYEYLEQQGWTVNALYHEPGMGYAGKYCDGFDEYYEYSYNDREEVENLPQEILDFTGALDDLENWEAEQEEEAMSALDRTDWFDKKTKPAHVGKYEVTTKNWPYPHYCDWTGTKWQRWEGDDIKVSQWRGLTKPFDDSDLELELQKLKEDYGVENA